MYYRITITDAIEMDSATLACKKLMEVKQFILKHTGITCSHILMGRSLRKEGNNHQWQINDFNFQLSKL